MKVYFLDKFESIVFGDFFQGIKGNQVLVDVEDGTRYKPFANRIGQVEVVFEAKWTITFSEGVLAKDNAEVFITYSQVVGASCLTDFVYKPISVNCRSNE